MRKKMATSRQTPELCAGNRQQWGAVGNLLDLTPALSDPAPLENHSNGLASLHFESGTNMSFTTNFSGNL